MFASNLGSEMDLSMIGGMPIKERDFSGSRFSEPPPGTHFVDCNFSGTRWQGVKLDGVFFSRCRFDQSEFIDCQLKTVRFHGCGANGMLVAGCELSECHIEGGEWGRCSWRSSKFVRMLVNASSWVNWQIESCDIECLTVVRTAIEDWNVGATSVHDGSLAECKLLRMLWRDVSMERVIIANTAFEDVAFLKCRGVNNRWMGSIGQGLHYESCGLAQNAWSGCQIANFIFSGSQLQIALFDKSILSGLVLEGIYLYAAAFDGAQLDHCSFRNAQAPHLSFRDAVLSECDLRGLIAPGFDARGCKLEGGLISGARFEDANLLGQNPNDWRGADVCHAPFAIPSELQDGDWWSLHSPGKTRVPA